MPFFDHLFGKKKKNATEPDKTSIIYTRLFYSNGKLLKDKKIKALKKQLPLHPGHYKRKKEKGEITDPRVIDSPYSITVNDNHLYAHYHYQALGTGSTAKVKVAQDLSSGELVAVKTLKPKPHQVETFRKQAKAELEKLKILGRAKSSEVIETKSQKTGLPKFRLFMELAKGEELFSLINYDKLPHDAVTLLQISLSLTEAVQEFLKLGYLHRDISMENIMINITKRKATLVDVGHIGKLDETHTVFDGRQCGSYYTTAPETLIKPIYSQYSEGFSLGVLLQAILFGRIRRWDKGAITTLQYQKELIIDDREKTCLVKCDNGDSYKIDYAILELTRKLLDGNPKNRPDLQMVHETLRKSLSEPVTHVSNTLKNNNK